MYLSGQQELEQEKFTLRRKLEAKEHMEQTYLDEIEMLKSTLSKQSESMRLKIEMQHDVEVQPLKSQVSGVLVSLSLGHLIFSLFFMFLFNKIHIII